MNQPMELKEPLPANWKHKSRFKASAIHLGISVGIALLAALLVFGLWYPYPYRETSGGRELFLILMTVDILLGPLITLVIFNPAKPRAQLVRDLSVVGLLQVLALLYGLWTVFVARPVHIVFEMDRFRIVHAVEVPKELLEQTPPGIKAMPLTGPTPLAVRNFKDAAEESEATLAALLGAQIGFRPDLWEPYAQARPRVLAAAKTVLELKRRHPQETGLIAAAVAQTGVAESDLLYLPVASHRAFWTALIDAKSAEIRGFIPLDSF